MANLDSYLHLTTFVQLALMIFAGMACGRLAKRLRLPNVTDYLTAGLLLGPSVLGLIPQDALSGLDLISNVALGFIAFSVGNEFKVSYFKRVGATPIVIAVFESLFAVLFVLAGLLIAGQELPFSLVLASIAAATAPAATIMVIRQYKAKGPVTETLLSVVALDDATALILFGICVAIAQALKDPAKVSIASSILSPVKEIGGALLLGAVLGLIFLLPLRFFKKDGNRLALSIGFIFAGVGLADMLGLSSLMLCMMMGATIANLSSQTTHIMKLVDGFTPPLFMLFFVASGAELQLSVLPTVGLAGALYVLLRVAGKMSGSAFGAWLCHADSRIAKYLGPALIPQAGVAIGLSLIATRVVPEHGATIRAIILCGTLLYEMVGPVVSKLCLKAAGEITEPDKAKPADKPAS